MELHYGRISGNSARSLFALNESGAKFEARFVDTKAGENNSPAYRAINPMGKIPALADGNFKLWESNAIAIYAAEKNPASRLIPADAQARASMYRWLFFQTAHVSHACVPLFRATVPFVQEFWQTKGDQAAAETARKELARFLPVLDAALQGRAWLEDEFSLADICYAPHLWLIGEGGFDFSPYPHLTAWMSRLLARPAWLATRSTIFAV